MFIEQPPEFFRKLYPGAVWRMDPNEKAVYLTFDDGPIPEVTPWVLDLLDKHNIKATFFMVGDNIRKHPDEFRMVVERGHRIGNHTFNHIRGFEYTAQELSGKYRTGEDFHGNGWGHQLQCGEGSLPSLVPPSPRPYVRQPVSHAETNLQDCDVGPRDPRLQQEAARSASASQRDALRPQRLHHHLPRFLEILVQRKPAVRIAARH